ncbi:hypothetical protein HOU03_gp495 [Caulobacter phage CcrSC]|uniref:Uncharacterized protein n=1 Tax=Caulobacter phage CcrSC TaxID=2283272 RepID=A0A385EFW7_9CAUD|nr:hypothetical protein HOU03_gp495 [Caulobacter phage CcrSC]AXQ69772.1 hypothetical protein CcrSC_gp190 [Caulobacter phage CcrSC]
MSTAAWIDALFGDGFVDTRTPTQKRIDDAIGAVVLILALAISAAPWLIGAFVILRWLAKLGGVI